MTPWCTRALAEGHTAGEPLVLTGGRDGLLLADREGMFPVAWTDTADGLLPAWNMCGSPPVLVAPGAAGALTELADAGVSFVVAAPPARGERWRRLPHGLWTNDHENPALARYAGGYQQAVDLAAELIRALARERAAVPLADGPALGRSLLLAAGLGLGTLAWTLWREREPTDPLLALERFADLSARVSFEPERVRVRLPLGPRHSDLSAHGLLADVPGVPWYRRPRRGVLGRDDMPNDLAIRHLLIRLRPLNRALRAAVERQAAEAAQLDRPDLVPYCITDEQVAALLDRLDALPLPDNAGAASLTPEEQAAEQQIREQASAAGVVLPLDELAGRLGLTDQEQQALLLCAAPELDRAYERVIAYVLDDLNRRFPCVELLTLITAGSGLGGLAERGVLSRTGRLRLLGLLIPYGEAPTDLRQELRVPSGVVDFLLGHGGDLAVLAHDPGAVPIPETIAMPPQLDAAHLDRLGKAIRAGDLDLVGVWGSPRAGQHEAVYALARAAGMPLRQVTGDDVEDALNVAAALGAILWLRTDGPRRRLPPSLGLLARSRTPVCLSGTEPWRPPAVLSVRAYAEIALPRSVLP